GFALMDATDVVGLVALNASDGSLRWHYDVHENVLVNDVINGHVYANVYPPPSSVSDIPPGFLVVLDSQTGKEIWRFQHGNTDSAGAIAANDQLIYTLSNDGKLGTPQNILYALNASDGSVKWKWQSEDKQFPSYLLDGDTLYLGATDGFITALNASDG